MYFLYGPVPATLLDCFRSLRKTSNSKNAKDTIYKLTGFNPKMDDNSVPDTDLNGYVEWLFKQHGFEKSPSTTLTEK